MTDSSSSGSSVWMEHYKRENPEDNYSCLNHHRYSTDRACEECGYGIWTDDIKCCHCGADNYCAECEDFI
jgi:hypothetical protein